MVTACSDHPCGKPLIISSGKTAINYGQNEINFNVILSVINRVSCHRIATSKLMFHSEIVLLIVNYSIGLLANA